MACYSPACWLFSVGTQELLLRGQIHFWSANWTGPVGLKLGHQDKHYFIIKWMDIHVQAEPVLRLQQHLTCANNNPAACEILTFSHLSTHLVWYSWRQGKTRTSCFSSKFTKHITHLWSSLASFDSRVTRYVGNWSISALDKPLGLASPICSARFKNV